MQEPLQCSPPPADPPPQQVVTGLVPLRTASVRVILAAEAAEVKKRTCHVLCLCSTPLLAILTFTACLLVAHVPATHECLACLHCCPSQASGQQQSFEAMRVCWC